MVTSTKRPQQQAALLQASPISKTSHPKLTDFSSQDIERELAFTLQDLSDMVEVQGITQVLATMRICHKEMYESFKEHFTCTSKPTQEHVVNVSK